MDFTLRWPISRKPRVNTKRPQSTPKFSGRNTIPRASNNAVVKNYGTRAVDDKQEIVGFPKTEDISDKDQLYFYIRDAQGARIVDKSSADPFKKGVNVIAEENFKTEADEFNKYFLPKLEDGLRYAMLEGMVLIYKNFNDRNDPDSEVKDAKPFSNDMLLDFSFISKDQIKEMKRNMDPTSENHNQIEQYVVRVKTDKASVEDTITIHHSRIIHLDYHSLPDSVEGQPLLLKSYNMFLTKNNIEFAMGEGYYRNANPLKILTMVDVETDPDEFDRALECLRHLNAQSAFVVPMGYTFSQLPGDIEDPKAFVDYIKLALSSMPESELWGVTAGTLAGSDLNLKMYYDDIINDQMKVLKPIIEDLYDQMADVGLWEHYDPKYEIEFPPLEEMSEAEISKISMQQAKACEILLGGKSGVPLFTPEELRLMFWPEMDDIPKELQDIWNDFLSMPEEELEAPVEEPFGGATSPWEVSLPPTEPVLASNKLPDKDRMELTDKWQYPQKMDELRMEADLLPLLFQDIDEFKEAVIKAYKEVITPQAVTQKEVTLQGRVYKVNEIDPEVIKEFISQVLAIDFNEKQMADLMAADMEEVFNSAVTFTFATMEDLAGLETFEFGSPRMKAWFDTRGQSHAWKFYNDVSAKVKFEMMEGIEKGEGINKLTKRLDGIAERKGTDLKKMVRTVVKESAHRARLESFKARGVTHLVFMATWDERTCNECYALDGKLYTTDEALGLIPVHMQCRCEMIVESAYPGGWTPPPRRQ